jgi:TorA maturation chaperone TorD
MEGGRPMTSSAPPAPELDLLALERARLFALLGRLLVAPPDGPLLASLRGLHGLPDRLLGQAYGRLARAARQTEAQAAEPAFARATAGLSLLARDHGGLAGAPLEAMLAGLGVGRAEGVAEPADHLGLLCEALAGLIAGVFPAGPGAEAAFFAGCLAPWAGRCFAALAAREHEEFYAAVGALGLAALAVEAAAGQAAPA